MKIITKPLKYKEPFAFVASDNPTDTVSYLLDVQIWGMFVYNIHISLEYRVSYKEIKLQNRQTEYAYNNYFRQETSATEKPAVYLVGAEKSRFF